MKKILFTLLLGLSGINWAQQNATYTHYMYNTLAYNPAYAGSREALSFTALGRFQWLGFKGAPSTQTFSVHAPIAKKNIGLGLNVVNDQIGPTRTTSFQAQFAYRLKINEKSRLCFGINGGIDAYSASLADLTVHDQNDATFQQNTRGRVLPNFGMGIYYQTQRFYAGFSAPGVLENDFYKNPGTTGINMGHQYRHYYVLGGAKFQLSPEVKMLPSFLVKMVQNSPLQIDLTANFVFRDQFELGGMYRWGDGIGMLAGIHILPQLLFGYSFDWSFGLRSGAYNGGSHELMLRYDLLFNQEGKIRSPRYF